MSQNRNVQMHRLITEANAPYGRMRGPAHDAVCSKLAGLSITCRTTSVSPASSIVNGPGTRGQQMVGRAPSLPDLYDEAYLFHNTMSSR